MLRWLVGSSVLSFAAALVMGAFGEDFVEPETASPSTFSWSALGHRAAAELLEKEGIRVLVRQDPNGARGGPKTPVLLLEPDVEKMRAQGTLLRHLVDDAWEAKAPLVVVLPKWRVGQESLGDPPWAETVTGVPLQEVNRTISEMGGEEWLPRGLVAHETEAGACEAPFGDVVVEVQRPVQLLQDLPEVWEPVVECENGTLLAVHRPSRTFLVSDPDLFANHALARGDHAEILLDLLKEELRADSVIFDEAVHGFRRRMSLLAELMRPPLVVATLHGTLVLGLVLWAGMGRFGKAQPPAPVLGTGKQALIENTAQLLIHGGHTRDSLARYFRDTLRAVAAHHQISADLTEGQVVARLQTIADAKRLELRLSQVQGQISRSALSAERALRLAKTIHQWRTEMTSK